MPPSPKPLPLSFYQRDAVTVARELIGTILHRRHKGTTFRARIVETEAYVGPHDLASHSSKGRTAEGFYYVKAGIEAAIARGLAYAPYCDMLWCETGKPDLEEAKHFAAGIHRKFPGKLLAYNCSPSFNWKRKLDDATIAKFQRELGAMGYKFQFITLAGFHALNFSMFELARGYKAQQMTAYVALQQAEFAAEPNGYTATKHQREVGAGYFDDVTQTVTGGNSSVTALAGSTEEQQFQTR